MACLVSLSFYIPLSAPPHTFFKEKCPMKSVLGGYLSNQPAYRTGYRDFTLTGVQAALFKLTVLIAFAAPKLSSFRTRRSCHRVVPSSNWSCRLLWAPSRRHCDIVSCHMNMESICTHMIISGYWVGPDIDDGWGYIEAFINPIT